MTRQPCLTLIAALDRNGVIGADGGMPWHIPGDLPRFKRLTLDKPILMGRRTFESIGKALPGRHNIVLSRQAALDRRDDITRVDSLAAAIAAAGDVAEIMVIGGAAVYALALPHAVRLLLTHIEAEYAGDTTFPEVDWSAWEALEAEHVAADGDTPAHWFMTYERVAG